MISRRPTLTHTDCLFGYAAEKNNLCVRLIGLVYVMAALVSELN